MSEMNNLQKALLIVEEERSRKYDDLYESPEPHEFSQRYLKRRQEIIDMCAERQAVRVSSASCSSHYRRAHRLRLRTLLVAALIMLLATVSVIAITKPHIYYVIKEKIDSWMITFVEEGDENNDSSFEIVRPQIPDGFTVVTEEELEDNYFLSIEDPSGVIINFEQALPDGATISVDSEHSENTTETINGFEIVVSKDEDATAFIFNDGKYIYQIYGNSDEDLLRKMMMSVIEK